MCYALKLVFLNIDRKNKFKKKEKGFLPAPPTHKTFLVCCIDSNEHLIVELSMSIL